MDRRNDIDFIKGIAIIAVVLYHVGILPYGFLGVEVFLVISGFLLIPKLLRQISGNEFHYFQWLFKHLYRIWPITLVASIVCLIIGYFTMIPDSYENLSESVVASNFFANNILSAITTKNYWDVSNEYKPLMQMWYLGIITQFYVTLPLILIAYKKIFHFKNNINKTYYCTIGLLGLISLAIYLIPGIAYTQKFYILPCRLWEFILGGIVGISVSHNVILHKQWISYLCLIIVSIVFIIGFQTLSQINTDTIIGAVTPNNNNCIKIILTIVTAALTGIYLLNNVKSGGVFVHLEKCHSVFLYGIR